MKLKIKTLKYYIAIRLIMVLNISLFLSVFANTYLPNLDEYRGVKEYIIEKPYKEYKSNVIQNTIESDFSQWTEVLSWQVQVKTVFDFYADKRAERIESIKNTLIESIKNKDPIKTWYDPIDTMITKLESPWKYFVIKTEGDVIPINEDLVLYLFDYKIVWKDEFIEKVKSQILNLNATAKKEKMSLDETNEDLKNIIKTLDNYKIKYKRISKSIDWSFYIWKWNWLKVEGKEQFFINKIFTTPELKEQIDKNNNKIVYFWTFVSNDELKTKYYSENNGIWYDVFVKILWDPIFAWNIKNEQKIYQSSLYSSKKDIFIYNIEKNKYEYFIIIILFVFWNILGTYLTFNFVNNFKNNFKKTPEEL